MNNDSINLFWHLQLIPKSSIFISLKERMKNDEKISRDFTVDVTLDVCPRGRNLIPTLNAYKLLIKRKHCIHFLPFNYTGESITWVFPQYIPDCLLFLSFFDSFCYFHFCEWKSLVMVVNIFCIVHFVRKRMDFSIFQKMKPINYVILLHNVKLWKNYLCLEDSGNVKMCNKDERITCNSLEQKFEEKKSGNFFKGCKYCKPKVN